MLINLHINNTPFLIKIQNITSALFLRLDQQPFLRQRRRVIAQGLLEALGQYHLQVERLLFLQRVNLKALEHVTPS